MTKTITIGDKPLKSITQDDLLQIVIIEGCHSLSMRNEEIAHERLVITVFDTTTYSGGYVLLCYNYKGDNDLNEPNESDDLMFLFKFNEFRFIYGNKSMQNLFDPRIIRRRLGLESIKYLISQGYDVPIY